MDMNVSKGEFDRRVKLLEQQVRTNTNDLINKLQAESEAFIEQLKQTNLDIDNLRQQIIDAGGETEEVERKLNDFVDSYNKFASNTLRFNDVFDSDGQFTGKIRPLSIETAALSVGTRSQQLTLNGIEFRVLPYAANSSCYLEIVSSAHSKYHFINDTQLQYNNESAINKDNAGQLFHYGFGTETAPKIYNIEECRKEITWDNNNYGYYIYARLPYNVKQYQEKTISSSSDFETYFYDLYVFVNSNYVKLVSKDYSSSQVYYTKTNWKFTSLGTIDEKTYINNIDNLYTSDSDESKVIVPTYNSETTYYEKFYDIEIPASNVANIIISQNQYTFKNDSSQEEPYYSNGTHYLVIKIGYIGKGMITARGTYERKVDMTYGQTTIDGRLITTGRIEGGGTNPAYFDLDKGEIGGTIKFTQNNTSILLNELGFASQSYVGNSIDNIEVGGRNLLRTNTAEIPYGTQSTASGVTAKLIGATTITLNGTITDASKWFFGTSNAVKRIFGGQYLEVGDYLLWCDCENIKMRIGYGDDATYQAGVNVGSKSSPTVFKVTTARVYWFTPYASSGVTFSNVTVHFKLEKGNKATDWTPAPEDTDAEIADINSNLSTKEEAGWIPKSQKIYFAALGTGTGNDQKPSTPSGPSGIVAGDTDNYGVWTRVIPTNPSNGKWFYFSMIQSWEEKNGTKRNRNDSQIIYEQGLTTTASALKGTTTISGGLLLTSKIITQESNGSNNCAVLNAMDQFAFWAGHQNASSAPVYITRTGDAKFGDILVNGSSGNITFNNSPLTINKSKFNFEKAYIDSVTHTNAENVSGNPSGRKKFTISGYETYGTLYIKLTATCTSTQYTIGTSSSLASSDATPVNSGSSITYKIEDVSTTSKTIYIKPYQSGVMSGYSINDVYSYDIKFLKINYKEGLNIYQNGITIADDHDNAIMLGIYNGTFYKYTLKPTFNNIGFLTNCEKTLF